MVGSSPSGFRPFNGPSHCPTHSVRLLSRPRPQPSTCYLTVLPPRLGGQLPLVGQVLRLCRPWRGVGPYSGDREAAATTHTLAWGHHVENQGN